jgi:hypothetical protein
VDKSSANVISMTCKPQHAVVCGVIAPAKVKEHSIITNVVNKSTKKAIEPDEQITVEPIVAIVKDLVTKNVED